MKKIVFIVLSSCLSVCFLDARQLQYRIRNKSAHMVSVRLIPDRNMTYIIKDPALNNDIYDRGMILHPDQTALVNFAISGKSKTWGTIKKHWGIETIQVVAQELQEDSVPYFKFAELAKADARRDLIVTITNPAQPGGHVNIVYE